MRRLMLAIGAVASLGLGALGCSHSVDEARADYHQSRAEHAAQKGDYAKAADQQRKEMQDRGKAATAPLP